MDTCLTKLGRWLLTALSVVAIALTPHAQAKSSSEALAHLKAMDDVLESTGSLENFLNSPEKIEQYYRACRTYYLGRKEGDGGRFPRRSFDAILHQFRNLLDRHPEFAERAWKKRPVRPILVIKSEHPGYGVAPQENFKEKFAQALGLNREDLVKPLVSRDLSARLEKFRIEHRRINGLVPQTGREARQKQAEFSELKHGDEAKALRSDILRQLLVHTRVRTLLNDADSDIVLSAYQQLREDGAQLIPEFASYREEIEFLIGTLPQAKTLAKNENLFRPAHVMEWVDNSQFEYVDIARPFHSLFRGLYFSECTGGDCSYLHWMHESRWGIPLLDGGHEIHVLRDGSYAGYISNVLVERDHHRYFALEILTKSMVNRIWTLRDFGYGAQMVKRSLLDVWIDRERSLSDGEVEGFLVGQSRALNPAGGLEAIRLSEAWMSGRLFGNSKSFSSPDPLAASLIERPKHPTMNEDYLNHELIFELGVIPAGEAVLLSSSDFDFQELKNPYWLAHEFSKGIADEAKLWQSLWFHPQLQNPESVKYLHERARTILNGYEHKSSVGHKFARQFLEQCEFFCIHGLYKYRYPGEFDFARLEMTLRSASSLPHYAADIQVWLAEQKLAPVLNSLGESFPVEKMKKLIGKHVSPAATVIILDKIIGRVSNITDFLDLTVIPDNEVRTRKEFGLMLIGHLETIEKLNPTLHQWRALYERLYDSSQHFKALQTALWLATTPDEFLERVTWPRAEGADMIEDRLAMDRLLGQTAGRFKILNPNAWQMKRYTDKIRDPKIQSAVMQIFADATACADIVGGDSKKAK